MWRHNQIGGRRYVFEDPPGKVEHGPVAGTEVAPRPRCAQVLRGSFRPEQWYTPQMRAKTHDN